MCNEINNNNCDNCISDILKVILVLQKNADCDDACLESCDKGFLGCVPSKVICNTRPIQLFTACGNGTPWTMPVNKNDTTIRGNSNNSSSVFRVEKLDGCCATCRVLERINDDALDCRDEYRATNSFFTINLNCVCCIRCLQDTFIDCL